MAKLKKLTKEMVLEELNEILAVEKAKGNGRPDALATLVKTAQARNRQVLNRQTRRP